MDVDAPDANGLYLHREIQPSWPTREQMYDSEYVSTPPVYFVVTIVTQGSDNVVINLYFDLLVALHVANSYKFICGSGIRIQRPLCLHTAWIVVAMKLVCNIK